MVNIETYRHPNINYRRQTLGIIVAAINCNQCLGEAIIYCLHYESNHNIHV